MNPALANCGIYPEGGSAEGFLPEARSPLPGEPVQTGPEPLVYVLCRFRIISWRFEECEQITFSSARGRAPEKWERPRPRALLGDHKSFTTHASPLISWTVRNGKTLVLL